MYRVGYQCFVTNEAAHDYLLSQQLPTITPDGKIIRPIKQGKDMVFRRSENTVELSELRYCRTSCNWWNVKQFTNTARSAGICNKTSKKTDREYDKCGDK